MWRAWMVLVATGCSPFTGFKIEKHSSEPEAVLPIRCADRLERTSGGLWVCQQEDLVVTSAGESIEAKGFGVAGSAVWTYTTRLTRYVEDGGHLQLSPDAGYDWDEFAPFRKPVRAVLAHERDFLLSENSLSVVAATDDALVVRSEKAPGFQQSSIAFHNSGESFLQLGSIIWAVGPGRDGMLFCPMEYSETEGITAILICTPGPYSLMGVGSGGYWMRVEQEKPLRFFRPAGEHINIVLEAELPPRVEWKGVGGVLWTTDPDVSTMRVPRVVGNDVVIDEYQASDGHAWSGANERWVFETPIDGSESTRVYAR